MYDFIASVLRLYNNNGSKTNQKRTSVCLKASLDENIQLIKSEFERSEDLSVHIMRIRATRIAIISIDNMVNKDILANSVIKPLFLTEINITPESFISDISEKVLITNDISKIDKLDEVCFAILSGYAVIAVDGFSEMLSVGIQGYQTRGISEPESDVVQRGSREGFVESLRTNISMLRRKIKSPGLCFETMTVGDISRTDVGICYLRDAVSEDILNELKRRLRNVDLDTVLSAGYLVPYLEDRGGVSPFRTVGVTERPDTVCGKLTEGRIVVMIDGVPSALIVPFLFCEYFQTLDDYSNRPYFSAFTRWLKYISFLVSILLPGIFTSLGIFSPEMFPTLLLNKLAGSIGHTPLSLTAETILILLVYEIMRESGLRMPQPLGYAVSIVGGLVIGDTAVGAGLIGAPTLMVVAVSAICSYIIPNLYAPAAILRLAFTICGGFFGIWGVSALFAVVLINICGKTSFGIPYTAPISPLGPSAFRDIFIRAGWKTLSAHNEKVQDMPGSVERGAKGND